MFDLSPEQADRDDSRFWYVDRGTMVLTKPGDTVLVEEVIGERFGTHDRVKGIGVRATFLGMFLEDEDDSLELREHFVDTSDEPPLTPEQIEDERRHPYFKAEFEGIGELTFAGIECWWVPVQPEEQTQN